MSEPVFVRTAHQYDSYRDFWRLVEISRFPTTTADSFDLLCSGTYIVTPMNGEFKRLDSTARDAKRGRVVWWYLERPDVGENYAKVPFEEGTRRLFDSKPWWVDEVWVSDKGLSDVDGRLRHVVLASDPRLALGPPSPAPIFAVAHMSYVWDRRTPIFAALAKRVRVAPCDWDPRRGEILRSSRSMLQVHQSPAPIGSPLRTALAAAYRLPLLSEAVANPAPLLPGRDILMEGYDGLVDAVAGWLGYDLCQNGEELHNRLCVERTFRSEVEKAAAAG